MDPRLCHISQIKGISMQRILFLVIIVILTPSGYSAQEPASWAGEELLFETFSIAGIDPMTGESGVAVTTRRPCVGNGVPWVRAGVGAVATQASTRVAYGEQLLTMIAEGEDPAEALKSALSGDSLAHRRQVALISINGKSAQHTGFATNPWTGHRSGNNYVAQGNGLVGAEVLAAVSASFESTARSGRHLGDRLIEALYAGQLAGGDQRKGRIQSAALRVADPRPGFSRRPDGVTTFISVCEGDTPVSELRRIYDNVSETLGYRMLQKFDGEDIRQLKILLEALGFLDLKTNGTEEENLFYDDTMVQAVDKFRLSRGLAVYPRSPAGLVDEETVENLWLAIDEIGKGEEIRSLVRDIARVRR